MRTSRSTRAVFRLSPLVAALACALVPAESLAAVSVVINTNDGGLGSLRDAITNANANCAIDPAPVITFNIPSGPFVISPSTPLPSFTCASGAYSPTIDGTTQPLSSPNTASDPANFNAVTPVALDATIYGGNGLTFDSFYGGVLTVRGLEIRNFVQGIVSQPSSVNLGAADTLVLEGNYFHGHTSVAVVIGNSGASGSSVGGTAASQFNRFDTNPTGVFAAGGASNISIAGNLFTSHSVAVELNSISNVTVSGNRIGNGSTGILAFNVALPATISGNYIGTLDGSTPAANASWGITWQESLGVINNNVLSGNDVGLQLFADTGTFVSGNFVGTNATGSAALANNFGIEIDISSAAKIQAPLNQDGNNVISGNTYGGIRLTGDGGSVIFGNKIGTNAAGTAALGNGSDGVAVDASSGTSIENNLISGNGGDGVSTSGSHDILIKDNTIGLDKPRTAALPNSGGIFADCGYNIQIQDNTISGNNGAGLTLMGTNGPGVPPPPPPPSVFDGSGEKRAKFASTFPNIEFNNIGLGSGGSAKPNAGNGIEVVPCTCFGTDGSGNGFLQNTIANNGGMGITLQSGVGNTMSQNSVYNNVVKNIDINNNYGGPLPNDPMDPDTGPNNQQNYPDNVTVNQAGGNTTIGFTLNSLPNTTFHIEIFDNPSAPALPAGQQYRADTFLTTDASGNSPPGSSFTLGALTNFITLTATVCKDGPASCSSPGDTSEFSAVGTFTATPAVSMSASVLDFGTFPIGQTSAPQTVTLASVGTAPYQISAIGPTACSSAPVCVGGDFTCTVGCNTTTSYVNPASCTISASFHPATNGTKTTTIFICDNAAGSPRSITLQGIGGVSAFTLGPSSFDFGNVLVGQASTSQDFIVTNSGTVPATLGPVSTSGDFNLVNTTCSGVLAASATCKATVNFTPSLPGLRTGTLTVAPPVALASGKATPPPAPATAALKGTGTQVAVLDMPSSVDFGSLTLNTSATSIVVTLRDTGNAVVSISSIALSGPFTLSNRCPPNLQPGQSCQIEIGFNPNTVGDFSGTLTIVSNASGGSRNIPVTAHTVPQAIPLIHVTPGFIGFGDRTIGPPGSAQRIQIRNDGGAAAPVAMTTRSLDFLIVGTSCGATIPPQGTCFADISFQPIGFGARSGQFRVNDNSTGDGQVTDLVGTGCRPFVPGTSRNHQASGGCTP